MEKEKKRIGEEGEEEKNLRKINGKTDISDVKS